MFTDKRDDQKFAGTGNLTLIDTKAEKWPFSTLYRYRYLAKIAEKLTDFSHIIYIDADMLAYRSVSEEEFFYHGKPLFGVQHPGNYLSGMKSFELNPNSTAFVPNPQDQSLYWQGCFWGGKTNEVLKLSRHLAQRIDDDLTRNIIAQWHDESHLNKYFIESADSVHTFDSGYAYPESLEGKLNLDKKFIHINKDRKKMRSTSTPKPNKHSLPYSVGYLDKWQLNDYVILAHNDGLRLVSETDSPTILNHDNQLVAKISATSARIWNLCDGRTSIGEVLQILSVTYASSVELIRKDVYAALSGFFERNYLIKKTLPFDSPSIIDKSGIRFYSFANNINDNNLSILKQSAAAHGIHLSILGDGLKRFSTTIKIDLLLLQISHLDDDAIVCMIDGFDIFFCGGGEELKRRFLAEDCDCIISAERTYSHQYEKFKHYYEDQTTKTPYRYLNAGSIIGYVSALKKMCKTTLSMKIQQKIFTASTINKIKRNTKKIAKFVGYNNFDQNFIYS